MFFLSQGVEQDAKKPHQKILFLAEVMDFFKSGSQYKSRYFKITLGTYFEKNIQARGLKLGSYVPLMSFYK